MSDDDDGYISYADAIEQEEQRKKGVRPEISKAQLKASARARAKQNSSDDKFQITTGHIIQGVVTALVFLWLFNPFSSPNPQSEYTPTETRQDKIDGQFSSWDGSHRDFVRRTKRALHDPSSFEHVRTYRTLKDNHIMVTMSYRAANGFGAVRLANAVAFYTVDGEFVGELPE